MNEKLIISACNYLIPELAQIINQGDYPDVQLKSFPANCSKHSLDSMVLHNNTIQPDSSGSDVYLIGSSCMSCKSKANSNKNVKGIHLEQCFEIFIGRETIQYYVSKGYFLVTNGWLKIVDQHIKNWGFNAETAKKFFRESMKGILLLNTKISDDFMPNLLKLSEYMGLPYEIVPIGSIHCKMYVDSLVLSWRNELERKKLNNKISSISKKCADYLVVFNHLETLVNITDETKIINIGFELLNILFAPSRIKYKKYGPKTAENYEFEGLLHNLAVTPAINLSFDTYYSDEILGKYEIEGIQFPQFVEQYKSMGKVIGQIFGLSLANARKYQFILNQNEQLEFTSLELQKTNQAKDKFFSIIAHDLKSPFNSILGFSRILVERVHSKDYNGIDQYAEIIQLSSNRAMDLILNLMEWSQSQTGRMEFNPEYFELIELIKDIQNLLNGPLQQKSIIFSVITPSTTPVFADKKMISTVLRNLISNAIKFTYPEGEIIVSVEEKPAELMIYVRDNGVGISNDNCDKLFSIDQSYSTSGTKNEKGTGLGLILCREFVEKHGGRIWVDSEVGIGSTFFFTIPNNSEGDY